MRSTATATLVVEPATMPVAAPPDHAVCVHPFRFDRRLSVEVPLVRWPDVLGVRERHAAAGVPCLLVVGATDRPPPRWGELEDWVRVTAARSEILTRATTVARRADHLARPVMERARAVRFRGRTTVVPHSQMALVTTLVERFGETVTDREIRMLFEQSGVSTHGEAVKTALRRLKEALEPVGLHLVRVRAAGYLLDRAD